MVDTDQLQVDVMDFDRMRVLRAEFSSPRSAGGRHVFFSEADFWPDPENPDAPYIRRDGLSNPNNFNEHRHALICMSIEVPALVAAYQISGDGN